ncbi:MAG: iron(III) transport system substrate-binding protein [Betaproteobacteria bacterium]|jgi:iron(III) transport system substrate-binding protein|nr:iron(III) transport system substrate-binding protein [Betaproteobacteria bacterium]
MKLLVLLAALGVGSVQAQTPASYEGADRQEKLLAGAKKEGELTIYTSAQSDDIGAVAKAFEAKYGVKVNLWRAGSEKVLQRAVTEARGGRHAVDVVETNGPELEMLHREQILQVVKSPHLADLIPAARRPHGEWVGTRLNVFALAYNTKLVKKDELPKTFADLAHPRWKGRLGIEADDQDWLAGVMAQLGEQQGTQIFRDIVKTNGISVRRGHTLLTQLVVSGEVPLALTVYNYKAEQFKGQGAPIEWFSIGKAVARPNGVAVARRAPHPHAAVLFFDFEIGEEGQRILAKRDFVPTNRRIDTPLNKIPLELVDPKVMLDEHAKWTKLYEELFLRQAR